MILLVISYDDYSTYKLIKWLKYYKSDFAILSSKHKIEKTELNIFNSGTGFIIDNGKKFSIESIDSVFFRRGDIVFSFPDKQLNEAVSKHLHKEADSILEFLIFSLRNNKKIGDYYYSDNKLIMLETAKSCGLKTPETIVSGSKEKVYSFLNYKKSIITKAIKNGITITSIKDGIYSTYLNLTNVVSEKDINEMSDDFFSSLFQQTINKKFEIRTFFLKGKCYSMAIFSQDNDKTMFDFRNYDDKEPNRIVPYNLPVDIEDKLRDLMDKLSLNTGSIDLIYTKKGEFVFLEVNPEGQFDTVSESCNYNLSEKIAKELIDG